MPVRRDERGRWIYRHMVQLPVDGNGVRAKRRIYGTAPRHDNTKAAAEREMLEAIDRLLCPERYVVTEPERKEVPTFGAFVEERFLPYSEDKNKHSEVLSKKSILERHLVPYFGPMRLDGIRALQIEDYKREKLRGGRVFQKPAVKTGDEKEPGLSRKTIDNHLIVLRRVLRLAREWELIASAPRTELYRPRDESFDFLNFEEAERLIAAAAKLPAQGKRDRFAVSQGDWGRMILVALKTGMRIGELLALRWPSVQLKARKIHVCESVVRGVVGSPKSGKAREVPLSRQALEALKAQRHLRGELVFCDVDGKRLTQDQCEKPLRVACEKAGLRRVTWHVLRHSFASHLVMRGVPLKAVQELLGHASMEMTMRYAHLAPEVRSHAVDVLDEPSEMGSENRGQRAPWQHGGSN